MGTLLKISTLALTNLNNAEYLSFMNSVIDLLPPDDGPEIESARSGTHEGGSPAIGLSAEFVQKLEKDVALLSDVVNESRIAQETEAAAVHEKNRDNLVVYITTRISRAGTLPLEAERDAGRFLYKVIKPYIGIARIPVAQETVQIQGMLLDLRKEENAPHATTLGLDAYLDELEAENNSYIALTASRTKNRAANKKESGTVIRMRIDEMYDDLTLLAQSYNVVEPSEASGKFVAELNQLISETAAAYNQRKKGNGSGNGEGGDDRPVIG